MLVLRGMPYGVVGSRAFFDNYSLEIVFVAYLMWGGEGAECSCHFCRDEGSGRSAAAGMSPLASEVGGGVNATEAGGVKTPVSISSVW